MRPAFRRLVSYAFCLIASALLVCTSGCGFATGGVVAATSSAGGGGNAPPASTGFTVLNPKLSPAEILLELTDADADSVEVEFVFQVGPSGDVRGMTKAGPNPVRLAASRTGVQHRLTWDFAAEPGIGTAALTRDVRLTARVRGGSDKVAVLDVGNDAPTVTPEPVNGEVSGVVPLSFFVADSSADISAIQVEYQVAGEPPDVWHLARAAGLSASEPTTAFSLGNVEATVDGTRRLFFWDSAYAGVPGSADFEPQLPGLERDVTFRFTASDSVVVGVPSTLGPVRVDNNAAPIVQINDGALSAGGDRRRTVALPFTVFDQESDTVDVVFQWKAASEAQFQDLGTTDPVVLRQLLQDESFARTKRICKGSRTSLYGSGVLLDGLHFRTSDFAGQHVSALARGIVGSTIDFLRPAAAAPTVVSNGWANNPLVHPVDVLALEDGVEVLVLDDLGGVGRLSVVEVATGALRVVAGNLPGVPDAMAWLPSRRGVVVASHGSTGWMLHEVLLADGQVMHRALATPLTGLEPIRDLVAYSERVVFATVANKVLRIDWLDGAAPRVSPLLDNLQEPRGILFDPHDPQRVFVAERTFAVPGLGTFGRIAAWDVRTRLPVAFLPVAQAPRRPTRLDLDPSGRRLCVLSETVSGGRELRRYELGNGVDGVFPAVPLGAGATAVAASVLGSWLAVDGAVRTLTVQGGIVERRSVTGYELATGIVTLDAPVVLAGPGLSWRLQQPSGQSLVATPQGTRGSFLWDTREVAGGGLVQLRAIAIDSELGQFTAPSSAISMQLDDVTDVTLNPPVSSFAGVVISDLDGDGRPDVKSQSRRYRQIAPRTFDLGEDLGTSGTIVLDFDGDGRNDLVQVGADVRIYRQTASGGFPGAPTTTIAFPADLIADLDGDGRFDLAQFGAGTTLLIRYQTSPLVWSAPVTAPGRLLADCNSDGRIDVGVKPGPSVDVEIYYQGSGGGFSDMPDLVVPTDGGSVPIFDPAVYPSWLVDVDRDGMVDVVSTIVSSFPGRMHVIYQRPAGVFSEDDLLRGGGAGFLGTPMDLDADGLLDFGGGVGFAGNSQALVRQCQKGLYLDALRPHMGTPATDIDGDGTLDFMTNGLISFARGEPNFHDEVLTGLSGAAQVLADFDRDGVMDLVVGRPQSVGSPFGGCSAEIFLQQEGDVFSSQPSQAIVVSSGGDNGDTPRMAPAGDMDLDGVPDYLLESLSNQVVFHGYAIASMPGTLSSGQGAFIQAVALQPMLCADVTGDIRPELLRGSGGSLRMDSMTLGPWPDYGPASIAVGDINNDGRRDIVIGVWIASGTSGTASGLGRVFLQNSDGTFPSLGTEVSLGTNGITKIRIADVDGDGVNDIVTLDTPFHALPLNRAAGVLGVAYGPSHSSRVVVSPGLAVLDFELLDCDDDGDLDFVCTTGELVVVRQLASRRYVRSFGVGQASGRMTMEDADGDGVADVAVSGSTAGVRILYGGR